MTIEQRKNLVGKRVQIIRMKDEPQMTDRIGVVKFVDSKGQIHGTWGSLAIQPENDVFRIFGEVK